MAGTASQANYLTGLGACYVHSGGVTVSTLGLSSNALNLTIAQSLLGATDAGGGLTAIGGGALTLMGSNTYTGPTIVTAGTLQIGGTQAGAIIASNGTTVGFSPAAGMTATAGPVTLGIPT